MLFTTKATSIFRLSGSLPLRRVTKVSPSQVHGVLSIFLRNNSNHHTPNQSNTTTSTGTGSGNDNNAEKFERLKETLTPKEKIMKLQPKQKIFNIPNILTMSRIASAPAIGYFIWNGMNHQALMCFAFAAATDLLDGIIARKFNQYTDLGAILDPIADKLLLSTCFIAMYNVELMPLWLIKGYVMRDIMIVGGGAIVRYFGFEERPTLRKYLDFQNHPTLGFEPTLTSKCNTAVQCAFVVYHLMFGYDPDNMILFAGHTLSACLASYSLVQYYARSTNPVLFQNIKIPKGWSSQVK